MCGSSRHAHNAAVMARIIGRSSALSAFGRFSVIRPTRPSWLVRTLGSSGMRRRSPVGSFEPVSRARRPNRPGRTTGGRSVRALVVVGSVVAGEPAYQIAVRVGAAHRGDRYDVGSVDGELQRQAVGGLHI